MTKERVEAPIHCPKHMVVAYTVDAKCAYCEVEQLRGNLSLAEEGLANAMQEIEKLRAENSKLKQLVGKTYFSDPNGGELNITVQP